MHRTLKAQSIAIADDGAVVLHDDELIALERDFQSEPVAAGLSNGNCTNASCGGVSNDVCQNNLCGTNVNFIACVNIGASCADQPPKHVEE